MAEQRIRNAQARGSSPRSGSDLEQNSGWFLRGAFLGQPELLLRTALNSRGQPFRDPAMRPPRALRSNTMNAPDATLPPLKPPQEQNSGLFLRGAFSANRSRPIADTAVCSDDSRIVVLGIDEDLSTL